MSYFGDIRFFLLLLPVLLLAFLLGLKEKLDGIYSLIVSAGFALLIFGMHPMEMLYLVLFLAGSILLIKWYEKERSRKGRDSRIYHLVVLIELIPLLFCKVTPLFHMNIFGFTGVSYLTFRAEQILIETYDGVINDSPALETLAFLLFFPSLSSGPIDRSRRFAKDFRNRRTSSGYLELCGKGIEKFLIGAVYKFILAAWAYKGMQYLDSADAVWYVWIGYAWMYSFYLFFDFAGYSAMAVGCSYVLGVELPDNFRMPFISTDIRDFWDRWHISLSHWFRDFIFTRVVMFFTKKKWLKNRLNRACAGFLVNMGIMGIWHGISVSYILYGLYHGLLLAVTEIYTKKSTFYKKHKKEKAYRVLSWFVTMQLVVFGFFLFSGKPVELFMAMIRAKG